MLMGSWMILGSVFAQKQTELNADTLSAKEYLPDVTIVGKDSRNDIHQMPEVVGTHIFAGKKNTMVLVSNVNGNLVMNNMRQVMAKVPGIHVWESDGSGIQIGIAARGLSPNRSWDFNVRQNGYDIAADPYGYPEAYYHPPMQAVQRIQVLKGAGSLQFGPQFGGMVNYIVKNGSDIQKKMEVESQQTVGSFGLFNSFNAVGGKTEKSHYYAYFDHRSADGWRENSGYKVNTGFVTFSHQINDKWKAGIEYTSYAMLSQQPGGLTDSMFRIDHRQSLRGRNWMNITWNTLAITSTYDFNSNQKLDFKLFAMAGDRNSIGFTPALNVLDTVRPNTLQQANRSVDIDQYRNWGAELRYLHHYEVAGLSNTFTAGLRYFYGHTHRFRNGRGDTRAGFNLRTDGPSPTDLDFITTNVAASVENIFRISKKFIIIPGLRWEHIGAEVGGRLSFAANGTPQMMNTEVRNRGFLLAGIGAEYHLNQQVELYANYTQSYRPIHFADLAANPTTDVIDPNLADGRGYNIDLGIRGKVKNFLFFDMSLYHLQYNNRIGTITQLRPDFSSFNFRTNIGASRARGVEAIVEINPVQALSGSKRFGEVSVFVSYAYNDAKYEQLRVVTRGSANNLVETDLRNRRVENAPEHILRAGINYFYRSLTLTAQVSHVSDVFTDANNTVVANAIGTNGLIPAYTIGDLGLTWKINPNYQVRGGVNNFTNAAYFTRRAGGYPGPGLMPADARNWYITFGIKF
jgi:Fe(3+) dicitrate transport protein